MSSPQSQPKPLRQQSSGSDHSTSSQSQLDERPQACSNDELVRRLSVSGNSESEVLRNLRNMNLGDDFWMYAFKVVPCTKSYSHKWTFCPCAHAGETARRRDPRTVVYKPTLCPLTKAKRTCPLGDNCLWSHNVFESWLHPARYKSRLCTFGHNCNRAICFFAHTAEELRCVPNIDDGKELDEREYLLQLMLAQESGALAAQQQQQQQQSMQQLGMGGLLNQGLMGGMGQPSSQDMGFGKPPQPRLSPRVSHAGVAVSSPMQTPQQLRRQLSAHQQQLDLKHEQMLGADAPLMMGMPHMGGPGGLSPNSSFGHSHPLHRMDPWSSPLGPAMGPPPRMSDPGMHQHGLMPAASPMLNPQPHLNRISDSGQAFGLASCHPQDLAASLETLVASLSNTPAASPQQMGGPPSQRHSFSGAPQNLMGGFQQQAPIGMQPPIGMQQQPIGMQQPAAAANAAQINNLVTQLQEQGLGNTKEEVVQSLTTLLAQLLSVN